MGSRLAIGLALVTAAGCGSGGPAPDADGGGPPCSDTYCAPGDFPRDGCTGARPAEVALGGIWHLDMQSDGGPFASVLRIDDAGGALSGLLFGSAADQVAEVDGELIMRHAWRTTDGTDRIQAADACAAGDDGTLWGHWASCWDGDCYTGGFTAYPVPDLDEPVSEGVTLVAEYAGQPAWPLGYRELTVNVRQHLGIDYVARYSDGLRIVDVSDPASPSERGHAPVAAPGYEIYNDVKVVDTGDRIFALCASNLRGVVVVEVTDPDAPHEVERFPPPPLNSGTVDIHSIFLEGTRAYLANLDSGGIEIWDVADPTAPLEIGGWVHPDVTIAGGFVHDLYVSGGRAYLDYWNLGLVILDTQATPADPTLVGVFDAYPRRTSHSNWVTTAGGRRVSIHGDEDFDAHVRIIDVDDQSVAFLDAIAEYRTRPQVSVHNIMAEGDLAFVTYYQDGFRVLDLSNPADPVEIAHYRTWDLASPAAAGYGTSFYQGAIGVDRDPATGLLHVVDTDRGLFLLRLDP